VAALASLDDAPASRLMNIQSSGKARRAPETILETLITIAPIIGKPRIVSVSFWLSLIDASRVVVLVTNETSNGEIPPRCQFV
jgi:hypothetical protein